MDGCVLGILLGFSLGNPLGEAEGFWLGKLVVGLLEGWVDGGELGTDVGLADFTAILVGTEVGMVAQVAQGPPQSTPPSPWFWMPSKQVAWSVG
jgi:hypothetical protein